MTVLVSGVPGRLNIFFEPDLYPAYMTSGGGRAALYCCNKLLPPGNDEQKECKYAAEGYRQVSGVANHKRTSSKMTDF